ncbi:MAG: 50S ribosomal protein L18 [Saprospiraceae bacterium]|nr:50S ribosomal protein L18 [Saprospiraceae bacterium]
MPLSKIQKRKKIHKRIRKSIVGTAIRPRACVFRSNKDIYCQIINDDDGRTLVAVSTADSDSKGTKTEQANALGKSLAEKVKAQNIDTIVFDRNGYLYHGRVKALAEGMREGGIKF